MLSAFFLLLQYTYTMAELNICMSSNTTNLPTEVGVSKSGTDS